MSVREEDASKRPSPSSIISIRRQRRGSIVFEAAHLQSKHFTSNELQNLAKQFTPWTNKQGKMDREGFRRSLGVLGMVQDALLCQQLFRVFNKSNTGEIDFQEYVYGLGVLMKGSVDEKLDFSFNLTDFDGSGEISYEELVLTVESMTRIYSGIMGISSGVLDKERISRIFSHLDRNGDGRISLEEYKRGMKRHPEFFKKTFGGSDLFRPFGANIVSAKKKIDKLEQALGDILNEIYKAEDVLARRTPPLPSPPKLNGLFGKLTPEVEEEFDDQSVSQNGSSATSQMKGDNNNNVDDNNTNSDHEGLIEEDEEIAECLRKARLIAEALLPAYARPTRASTTNSNIPPPTSVDLETDQGLEEEEKVSERNDSGGMAVETRPVTHEEDITSNNEQQLQTLPATKGSTVYFGHKNWDLVMNVMKGIQMAVTRSAMESDRIVSNYDYSVKEKYTLVSAVDSSKHEHRARFVDYCPFVFAKLRQHFNIDHEEYMGSIGPGSEGKSGSFFYLSSDNRFLVKTVRKDEHKLLRKMLPAYYRHMTKAGQNAAETPDSLLTRIVGCHVVRSFKRSKSKTGARKVYFVVMTNALITNLEIDRRYDLKGSWVGRKTSGRKEGKTLKDVDFKESKDRVFVDEHFKKMLMASLRRDANFLESQNIIDYSVLLGIHDHLSRATTPGGGDSRFDLESSTKTLMTLQTVSQTSLDTTASYQTPFFAASNGGFRGSDGKQTYLMGIIDFLTQYGQVKQLERAFKTIAYFSNRGGVSVMPARAYSKRFLAFLEDVVIVTDDPESALNEASSS